MEDLPSSVRRSPQATDSPRRFSLKSDQPSPTQMSSPLLQKLDSLGVRRPESPIAPMPPEKDVDQSVFSFCRDTALCPDTRSPRLLYQYHKPSNLKSAVDGRSFNLEFRPAPPLSPFTRAGFLRRLMSSEVRRAPTPPSRAGSADLCDDQEASKDEQGVKLAEDVKKAERSGHSFLGLFGRRPDRRSVT